MVAPLVVGFATGHPELVFAALGAMFLTNTEGPNATPTSFRFLVLATFTEPFAFATGTLAGLTGLLAVPLVGAGVSVALVASGTDLELAFVGRFTAIFFAVGVGLQAARAGAPWRGSGFRF